MSKCYKCKEVGGCMEEDYGLYNCFYCGFTGSRIKEAKVILDSFNLIFKFTIFVLLFYKLVNVTVNNSDHIEIIFLLSIALLIANFNLRCVVAIYKSNPYES